MAFLSYSHRDAEVADWLHEELEEFKVPAALVGKLTDQGVVPKKLSPVFRDRQELAAAHDLSEEIEEAMAGSRFLIVLCSPAAAKSRWINEEIACFKRLHNEKRIFAAIIDGEPFASDVPGNEERECFPAALRTRYDGRGRPTSHRAEPIAADLREDADGRHMGFLKIAAGMLGVGLDDLAQREAHRRQRRLYAITAASVAGMLFTSGLAYTAIEARDEARDQRREAEGLIGFMLGDLREKLEPVGRLDALDSVGARALAYFESQNKSDLSDEALAQRSRALTLIGEMAFARGDLDGALRRYREAMASTAEAVRREPDKPQNLYDHAQNLFWVGFIDYRRGNLAKAAVAFQEYRRLAERMVALAPQNDAYRLERIYSETNLGTVLMAQRKYQAAADAYQASLESAESLVAKEPANSDYQDQLIELLAWLGDARESNGQLDEALVHRRRQMDLLTRKWAANEGDTIVKRQEMTARMALARLALARNDIPEALKQSGSALQVAAWLTKTEPNNTEWLQAGANAGFERTEILLAAGRIEEARSATSASCNTTMRLIARDPSVTIWRNRLRMYCLRSQALVALRSGVADEGLTYARQALALARAEDDPINKGLETAAAETLLGDALAGTGRAEEARAAYLRALSAWPTDVELRPRDLVERSLLLAKSGKRDDAKQVGAQLRSIGYRNADFWRAMARYRSV
jgi:tetratricopeptide (TPR) repeat protein